MDATSTDRRILLWELVQKEQDQIRRAENDIEDLEEEQEILEYKIADRLQSRLY